MRLGRQPTFARRPAGGGDGDGRAPRARGNAAAVLSAVAAVVLGSCGARPPVDVAARSPAPAGGAVVSSNILRSDYAGSAACKACHGDVVSRWVRSPMHRMTRLPEGAEIRAPFDGREFRFHDDVVRFEEVRGTRFMRLRHGGTVASGTGERVYRVTKVIGGRYREDFAGLEVAAAEPAAPSVGDPGAELILPASYVFETASFRLKGYSVMVGERPGLRAGGVWNRTCIFCHNTVPYFDDLWGALYGAGAPAYQGEVVDRVLPAARRLGYRVTDGAALLRALDAEVEWLRAGGNGAGGGAGAAAANDNDNLDVSGAAPPSGDVKAALRGAMTEARTRFGPRHFVEIGIGCEACHGGAREHVDDPGRHPAFQPRAAFLAVLPAAVGAGSADRSIAEVEWQNRACARCHQVLFSRYPRTWEGGWRRTPGDAGGSHISSGEARDFLLGGCASAMKCTACHDPHGEDRREDLARLATPAGNGVCTGCHQKLAAPAALAAHAHHDPAGAGGACIACHMPRKNMGLSYALTRYHRIGSPTDPARIERDRPLECALCHAEKSVRTLLGDLERLWGKHYDQAALVRLYGSLDANVLLATIDRGAAHEQAAAIGAAAAQGFEAASAAITREIERNAFPLVRYFALAARARLEGRPLKADEGAGTGADFSGTGHGAPADAAKGEDED